MMQDLKASYESELLSYLPNPEDSVQAALLFVVLSSHAVNEEYIDHDTPQWIQVRRWKHKALYVYILGLGLKGLC